MGWYALKQQFNLSASNHSSNITAVSKNSMTACSASISQEKDKREVVSMLESCNLKDGKACLGDSLLMK